MATTATNTQTPSAGAVDPNRAFLEHRAAVYRWACGLGCRPDEAPDVVQDVFVRLLRAGPGSSPAPAAVGSWLRRTTSTVVVDRWRSGSSRRARESGATEPPAGAPPADADRHEQVHRLREAVSRLSEQQRIVLICKAVDGMSFAQIARELGLAVPTVKTHFIRALDAARGSLDRETPNEVNHEL